MRNVLMEALCCNSIGSRLLDGLFRRNLVCNLLFKLPLLRRLSILSLLLSKLFLLFGCHVWQLDSLGVLAKLDMAMESVDN